jgi:hypothetical protein
MTIERNLSKFIIFSLVFLLTEILIQEWKMQVDEEKS